MKCEAWERREEDVLTGTATEAEGFHNEAVRQI